jgi:prevent-host-death family protein
MQSYTLQEAQHQLKELIEAAVHGDTILITREGGEAVQLVPVSTGRKPRQAGSARDLVKMSDDFDAPLSDFAEYTE